MSRELRKTHQELMYFILTKLSDIISESHIESCCGQCNDIQKDIFDAALMQYCPVIVGGCAYNIYMSMNNAGAGALFSDDIDVKIAIQKTTDQLNTTDKLLRYLIKTFRYNIVKKVMETASGYLKQRGIVASLHTGGHNNRYKTLDDLYRSIKEDMTPLDLCYIRVEYKNKGSKTKMGLFDTTMYVETEDESKNILNQFDVYRDFMNVDRSTATSIIGTRDLICAKDQCVLLCNEIYLLLDTVRMLSKIEALGDVNVVQPTSGDYYKFAKYAVKFLHLLQLRQFREALAAQLPLTADFSEVDGNFMKTMQTYVESKNKADVGVEMKRLHTEMMNHPSSLYTRAYRVLYTPFLQNLNANMVLMGGANSTKRSIKMVDDMMMEDVDVMHTQQTKQVLNEILEEERAELIQALQTLQAQTMSKKSVKKSSVKSMSLSG